MIPLRHLHGLSAPVRRALAEHGVTTVEGLVSLAELVEVRRALRRRLGLHEAALEQLVSRARECLPSEAVTVAAPIPRAALGVPLPRRGPAPEAAPAAPSSRTPGLPSRVVHVDLLRPVRDQGNRGTCVAFAFTAAYEFAVDTARMPWIRRHRRLWRIIFRGSGPPGDHYSPQFLYWACKQRDGRPGPGTYMTTGAECLEELGVCRESAWPYNPQPVAGNEGQGPPPRGAEDKARRHCSEATQWIESDVRSIKGVLAGEHGPPRLVVCAVPVFPSWGNAQTHRTGEIIMPFPGEPPLGGHAICLCGYLDDDQAPGGGWFVFRNSWGTGWAAESPVAPGYGLLPYGYMTRYGWDACTPVPRAGALAAHAARAARAAAVAGLVGAAAWGIGGPTGSASPPTQRAPGAPDWAAPPQGEAETSAPEAPRQQDALIAASRALEEARRFLGLPAPLKGSGNP